jgi:polysaccharide biosynthesis/export protein
MQPRVALTFPLVISIAFVLFDSSSTGQEVKAVSPVSQVAQQIEAVRPISVTPVSQADAHGSAAAEIAPGMQDISPVAGSDVLINSGDLLAISLYGITDFSREVRVSERGNITLPLIGDVHVAELAIHDAEALVQKRLVDGGFFVDPQVSITAKESASQGTSVLGEVQKPGIYILPGQHALFDALSAAGGITPRAGNTIVITHRGQSDEVQTVKLPPDQTLPPECNVAISPGDTIVVSKAGIVYVIGDVHLPGGFIMENSNLTILQAVAMAQGANPTAKLDRTILIRRTPDGREEIPVRLSKVMAAESPDPKLQAGDVIFVPRSNAKAGFRRGLDAAMEALVGAAIYRPI